MDWSQGGDFTKSLLSLQLQMQTLLDGIGGEGTAGLLDELAKLSETERSLLVPALKAAVAKFASSEQRLQSQQDLQMEAFENELYESVLSAMGDASGESQTVKRESGKKLAVVPGGKSNSDVAIFKKPVRISSLIDLGKARESRKLKTLSRKSDNA